eukprot:gene22565-29219_t
MGGGVSLIENMQEVMVSTILIGRAISAVSFPGMYRIYDFHSARAPKLKNAQRFAFFAPDSDDEDDDDEENVPDPVNYEHLFKVIVGNDVVYIEHPIAQNEAGWTPLHSCCMSTGTIAAGLALIEETLRQGGDFETKTLQGPGTFNKGWTPLHMACAYGVEALVEKLVASGANVNSTNSFGFSCLLEASHRGFINIVKFLVRGPISINFAYIPLESDAMNSPFSSAPCQSALAEASRCGFCKVVQILLDAGAPKNLPNNLGWNALHEACFYNRIEIVKTLLLAGADPALRTKLGALPYHLAGLNEIRNMLKDMGGSDAVPTSAADVIDMVDVLTELTMPESMYKDQAQGGESKTGEPSAGKIKSGGKESSGRKVKLIAEVKDSDTGDNSEKGTFSETVTVSPQPRSPLSPHSNAGLIHSGPMLGDLPALSTPAVAKKQLSPTEKTSKALTTDLDAALGYSDNRSVGQGVFGTPTDVSKGPSRKADDKKGKKKKKPAAETYANMPEEYLCQLTRKPMSEPVKTKYGNVYDQAAILKWLNTQGKICAPLSEVELTPVEGLGDEIRSWILRDSTRQSSSVADSPQPQPQPVREKEIKASAAEDDLYDF